MEKDDLDLPSDEATVRRAKSAFSAIGISFDGISSYAGEIVA
jgi:hypothetical protein